MIKSEILPGDQYMCKFTYHASEGTTEAGSYYVVIAICDQKNAFVDGTSQVVTMIGAGGLIVTSATRVMTSDDYAFEYFEKV